MRGCAVLVLALTACLSAPSRPNDTCATFGPWQASHKLDVGPDLGDETGAWLSPDGLDLWYAASSGSPHMRHAHRADTSTYVFDQQSAPDIGWQYSDPFLSYDQLEMWHESFMSSITIEHATRVGTDIAFNDVDRVYGDSVMTYSGPSVTADKKTMVLCRADYGTSDPSRRLYVGTRGSTSEAFGAATLIAELNGTNADFAPSISADGKTLFWTRDDHLMMATLNTSGLWANASRFDAVGMGNTYADPFYSKDGRSLVYSQITPGDPNGADLYMIERECQ